MRIPLNIHIGLLLMIALILNLPETGLAKESSVRFESIRLDSAVLKADIEFELVLDRQVIHGLRKGMTALLVYRAQVWKEGPIWMRALITEKQRRFKIHFDSWEQQFVVTPREGALKTMTEKELMEYCHKLNGYHLIEKSKLDSGKVYRIWMSVLIKPMSVENMKEIKHWLAGEADDFNPEDIKISNSPLSRMGDWFLNMVVNVTGFGDRVYTGKSSEISIFNQTVILRDE